jgi:hypothetical protein
VANNPDPFVKIGSTSTLRATWVSQPHYIADLLRFGLWSERYLGMYTEELTAHVENLVVGPRPLKLRPGVTRKMFHSLMVAAIEGISLHAIADENAAVYEPAGGTNVAAMFGMALLLGCTQRATDELEVGLEEAVQELIYGGQARP